MNTAERQITGQEAARNMSQGFQGLTDFINDPSLETLGVNMRSISDSLLNDFFFEDKYRNEKEFLLSLSPSRYRPDILQMVIDIRTKLANNIKITNQEADLIINSLKAKYFGSDLDLSGFKFDKLDMKDVIIKGDLDLSHVSVVGDSNETGMKISGNCNKAGMKVGGDSQQSNMQVGGNYNETGMEVEGGHNKARMKVGGEDIQTETQEDEKEDHSDPSLKKDLSDILKMNKDDFKKYLVAEKMEERMLDHERELKDWIESCKDQVLIHDKDEAIAALKGNIESINHISQEIRYDVIEEVYDMLSPAQQERLEDFLDK